MFKYLFDKEKWMLAICAGIGFAASLIIRLKGWKMFTSAMIAPFICFQIFTVWVMWQTVTSQEFNTLRQNIFLKRRAKFY